MENPKLPLGQNYLTEEGSCNKYFWFNLGCMTASLRFCFEWRPHSTGIKTSLLKRPGQTLAVWPENWGLLPSSWACRSRGCRMTLRGLKGSIMEQGELLWAVTVAALAEYITIPLCSAVLLPPSYMEHGLQKETVLFGRWQIISIVLFFCLLKQI